MCFSAKPLLWRVRASITAEKEQGTKVFLSTRRLASHFFWVRYSSITHTCGNKWTWIAVYLHGWNCSYIWSVCAACQDNTSHIFLLCTNSACCQIDKKCLCSHCCWWCRWEPRVLFPGERRRGGEGWRNGNWHKHENINKLQPLGFHHPPSPPLCICLHLQWTLLFILLLLLSGCTSGLTLFLQSL